MQTRFINNSCRKISKEERTAEFIISDASVDRHGTILDMNWDVEKYKLNPIVGYMHQVYGNSGGEDNPDQVIGTSEIFFDDNKLIGKVSFEPKEINPLAEKIYQKVLFGTLRAASVGFMPTEEGKEEKIKVDGVEKDVFKFGKRDLLEWSIVKIPSNPNAIKRIFEEEESLLKTLRFPDKIGTDGKTKDDETSTKPSKLYFLKKKLELAEKL